jgi:hypothetical protein
MMSQLVGVQVASVEGCLGWADTIEEGFACSSDKQDVDNCAGFFDEVTGAGACIDGWVH